MRIIIFTKSINRDSGGTATMLDVADTLYQLGHDVHIGLLATSKLFYLIHGRKKVRTQVPVKNIHTVPSNLGRLLFRRPKINKYRGYFTEKILRPLYIFINKSHGFATQRIFFRKLRNADFVLTSLFFEGANEKLRSVTNAKIILNHAGSVESFEKFWLSKIHQPISGDKNLSLYVNYCRQYDKILFQAPDQADECRNKSQYLKNLPFVIKPSCEESKVIAAKLSISPYTKKTYNIVNVGSVNRRKAQHHSIDAFALIANKYPNIHLHFVGGILDIDYYNELLGESFKKFSNRIHFHGHKYDYLRYLSKSDALLQTSNAEGVSRIVREAMLLRIPIISFEISGIKSILKSGSEAYLVEPGNIEGIAQFIGNIIEDKESCRQLASAAHQKYLLSHSWTAYADAWQYQLSKICRK